MGVILLAALALVGQEAEPGTERARLIAELTADVQSFRASLPARDGPLTINEVRLDGATVVYTGVVDGDLDSANVEVFRREVRDGLCRGEGTGGVIRGGGGFSYDLRDPGGERFVVTVASCD